MWRKDSGGDEGQEGTDYRQVENHHGNYGADDGPGDSRQGVARLWRCQAQYLKTGITEHYNQHTAGYTTKAAG
ncbi:hypothetical protein TAMC210_03120 [Thermanaeromonas sp. C210]|nr:hypothetical protein TAMC210_03120 [Thermanaeromonas sp. C210]